MRTRALKSLEEPSNVDEVRDGIIRNLNDLADLAVTAPNRDKLTVAVYDSLPSISVYSVDDYYSVGYFGHRGLAINNPQFVATNNRIIMGLVQNEMCELKIRGKMILDFTNWRI